MGGRGETLKHTQLHLEMVSGCDKKNNNNKGYKWY